MSERENTRETQGRSSCFQFRLWNGESNEYLVKRRMYISGFKILENKLLKRVLDYLANHGFEKKIYGQSFHKKIDAGRQNIHISIIKHDNDFDVTVSAGLRFDMLEDLKNEDNNLLSEKKRKHLLLALS